MPTSHYSKDEIVFRTDFAGNPIVIHEKTFLFNGTVAEMALAIAKLELRESGEELDLIAPNPEDADRVSSILNVANTRARESVKRVVRGAWRLASTDAFVDRTDVLRLVRDLRSAGLDAQPNHAYFFSTVGNRPTVSLAPNLFAPNLFAPNLFAPNLFAPNLFAPNLFAPNLFAPNLFAPNGLGPQGGCHCPPGLVDTSKVPVPNHAAKSIPAKEALQELQRRNRVATAEPKSGSSVEIHLIDFEVDLDEVHNVGPTPEAKNPADQNEDEWMDPVVGHGTFVQGILERVSGVTADLEIAGNSVGVITDDELVDALIKVQTKPTEAKHKILNLSLAGYTEDNRPTPALADQIAAMVDDGWLVVAAAGNNSSCRLAFPAALPGVVAVAAINSCGSPAWFSNYGPWIDASALGVDVVSEFPILEGKKPLKVREETRVDVDGNDVQQEFDTSGWTTGHATWSGTSFAAPVVAGRLARLLESSAAEAELDDRKEQIEAALDEVIRNDDLCKSLHYGTRVD